MDTSFQASVAFPLKLGAGMSFLWRGDEDYSMVFFKGLAEGQGLGVVKQKLPRYR